MSLYTSNSAGRLLIKATQESEHTSVTHNNLNKLNKRWQHLQKTLANRHQELEGDLNEVQQTQYLLM